MAHVRAPTCSVCCKTPSVWLTCPRRFGRRWGGDAAGQRAVPPKGPVDRYRRSLDVWRFLEMPVPIVLLLLWLAGTAILGACGLTLYALVSPLA